MSRRQKREQAAELECAMCVGNRQLLLAVQQDVAAMRQQLEQLANDHAGGNPQ